MVYIIYIEIELFLILILHNELYCIIYLHNWFCTIRCVELDFKNLVQLILQNELCSTIL